MDEALNELDRMIEQNRTLDREEIEAEAARALAAAERGEFGEDAPEERPPAEQIPVPTGWFDDLEEDQLDYESEWEDGREDFAPDLSRSVTFNRGCIVDWFCRKHPEPNDFRGCEADCLWTRDVAAEKPHCFGYHRGVSVLEDWGFLDEVVQTTCSRCVHERGCEAEAKLQGRKRRGP